ncbi:hypothetical protein TrLO_g3974 [Triparma laevis f. longispina]|uniref:Uncharacterized protein n=1 Tax=Triparma laevis f. longispina TaxID=1714387 RepID=A0A9W6ZC39_9STRA|nr:hypothetical protein TrLO_g3974 [Triparma laevis f. longispina]
MDFDLGFSSLSKTVKISAETMKKENYDNRVQKLQERSRRGHNKYVMSKTAPTPAALMPPGSVSNKLRTKLDDFASTNPLEMAKTLDAMDQVKSLHDMARLQSSDPMSKLMAVRVVKKKMKKTKKKKKKNSNHLAETALSSTKPISVSRPNDVTSTELHIIKWVVLRETYLDKLSTLSTNLTNPTNALMKSTYDGLLSLLRKITAEIVLSITHWRNLSDSWEEEFVWAGVNYLIKISKDTAFLHRIDKLEKYLGLRLKKNPLIFFYNVDGSPSNLPGVPVKRRSKKLLPECLRDLNEYEVQECNRTINEEMERKKEYYDTDDEDDYDEMIEGLGFKTLTSAELEEQEMEEAENNSPMGKKKKDPKSPSPLPPPKNKTPMSWKGLSSSAGVSVAKFVAKRSPSPVRPQQMEKTIKDSMFTLDGANHLINNMLRVLDANAAEVAREGPIFEYFLIWKKWHWKQQNLKAMVKQRDRKVMRDIFYSWAQLAYRQIHAQRLAARAIKKKRNMIITNLPQTVAKEILTAHFHAWRTLRAMLIKVRAFRRTHGAKFLAVCLGAWMHYTRVEYGVKRIRGIVMIDLIRDVFFRWKRGVALKDYLLNERYNKRNKMTLGGKKWCRNAFREWKHFIYTRHRIQSVNKLVRRVRKFHAFNLWLKRITEHNLNLNCYKSMVGAAFKLKKLLLATPFKRKEIEPPKGVFVSEIVYKRDKAERKESGEEMKARLERQKKKKELMKKKKFVLNEDGELVEEEEREEEEEASSEEEEEEEEVVVKEKKVLVEKKEEVVVEEEEEEESSEEEEDVTEEEEVEEEEKQEEEKVEEVESEEESSEEEAVVEEKKVETEKEEVQVKEEEKTALPPPLEALPSVNVKKMQSPKSPKRLPKSSPKSSSKSPKRSPKSSKRSPKSTPKRKKGASLFERDAKAKVINQAVRGYLIRKECYHEFEVQHAAVAKIESWWARVTESIYATDLSATLSFEEFEAGMRIISWWRVQHWKLKCKRGERRKTNLSALLLQKSFRSFSTRKDLEEKKKRASVIQNAFRRKSKFKKETTVDGDGNNSMLYAVKSANKDLLSRLILKGWDLKALNDRQQNLFHVACSSEHSGSQNCVKLILDSLSDDECWEMVSAVDEEGKTPLHYAARRGKKEVILLLINKGAGMEVYDNGGKTPLHYSVLEERMKGTQCLIDVGFPVDCVDCDGQTCMHEAASLGNWRIGDMLFHAGASIDVLDSNGMSPLHQSVVNDKIKFVQLLLARGANPDLYDGLGRTAIHLAVDNRDRKIVELLCKNHANVNIRDADGNTPLHWAAMSDARTCIEVLLEYHADGNIVNSVNMPPRAVADNAGYGEASEMILKGANSTMEELSPLEMLLAEQGGGLGGRGGGEEALGGGGGGKGRKTTSAGGESQDVGRNHKGGKKE